MTEGFELAERIAPPVVPAAQVLKEIHPPVSVWQAFENGVLLDLPAPIPALTDASGLGLRQRVAAMVRERPGFDQVSGDLSWEWTRDKAYDTGYYDLWWLPADHGPTVDMHIRVQEKL